MTGIQKPCNATSGLAKWRHQQHRLFRWLSNRCCCVRHLRNHTRPRKASWPDEQIWYLLLLPRGALIGNWVSREIRHTLVKTVENLQKYICNLLTFQTSCKKLTYYLKIGRSKQIKRYHGYHCRRWQGIS